MHRLYGLLLSLGLRFALYLGTLLPQLLTARLLVFLNQLVGDHVHHRVLCDGDTMNNGAGNSANHKRRLFMGLPLTSSLACHQ